MVKTLSEYLKESIINEASEVIMHTQNSFDGTLDNGQSVEDYFNENGSLTKIDGEPAIKLRGKSYITLDQIKEIYDYAIEHKMPCPMIVNYGRKPGLFVFRRWVGNMFAENEAFSNIDFNKAAKPYMGLHNTNLKDSSNWFPSAEDMESCICFTHNMIIENPDDIDENILFVTSKTKEPNSKAEQLVNYCTTPDTMGEETESGFKPGWLYQIAEHLQEVSKLQKLQTAKIIPTDEWKELGGYEKITSINKTPKTDIINDDGTYKISLKKEGGSQLMSGFAKETRATLLAAARGTNVTEKEVNELFEGEWLEKIKNDGSKENAQRRENAKASNKTLTSKLNALLAKDQKFKYNIIYEAITGKIKFGEDNPACANYVFVWSEKKPNESQLYTVEEYAKKCATSPKTKFEISLKTASDSTSQCLRIITA